MMSIVSGHFMVTTFHGEPLDGVEEPPFLRIHNLLPWGITGILIHSCGHCHEYSREEKSQSFGCVAALVSLFSNSKEIHIISSY